jgi:hypothetical protein
VISEQKARAKEEILVQVPKWEQFATISSEWPEDSESGIKVEVNIAQLFPVLIELADKSLRVERERERA